MKCSDQFRVIKGVTDCFKYLYIESTKPSVNVKCLAYLNFLIDLRFLMLFTEGRGGVTELTEWVRHVDDLVAVSPPLPSLIWVEKRVAKLPSSEAAIQG